MLRKIVTALLFGSILTSSLSIGAAEKDDDDKKKKKKPTPQLVLQR
jgi:hypothetical protein